MKRRAKREHIICIVVYRREGKGIQGGRFGRETEIAKETRGRSCEEQENT
jgi:hypothetical protein